MLGSNQSSNADYAEKSRGFIQYVQTYFFRDSIAITSCHILPNISSSNTIIIATQYTYGDFRQTIKLRRITQLIITITFNVV